jgi:uncharacterized membrane protein
MAIEQKPGPKPLRMGLGWIAVLIVLTIFYFILGSKAGSSAVFGGVFIGVLIGGILATIFIERQNREYFGKDYRKNPELTEEGKKRLLKR